MQRNSADKWPSTSIGKGGVFHRHGVEYSQETHDLIKLLMTEQKISMFQQSKINSYLRSGQSLPKMTLKFQKSSRNIYNPVPSSSMCVMAAKRRTLAAIIASGDFDRELYISKRFESCEEKKHRLQEQMSGLKHFTAITGKKCIESTLCDDKYQIDPIMDLLHEIQERLEWIDEMDKLGEGYEHKQVIRNEIAERLNLIKSYDSKLNSNV